MSKSEVFEKMMNSENGGLYAATAFRQMTGQAHDFLLVIHFQEKDVRQLRDVICKANACR